MLSHRRCAIIAHRISGQERARWASRAIEFDKGSGDPYNVHSLGQEQSLMYEASWRIRLGA